MSLSPEGTDAESMGSIGGYELIDRLGSGGMGVVYLARAASGRQVAVKLIHAPYARDEEFRVRFRQEVAAARRVSGAFTAPVVDADPDAEQPWMATLYVPGRTLSETVTKEGPLGGRELRTLGLGLVEALRDIHQAGLVHRDLKPSNVLMAEDGPRVIDFGISRATDNQALTVTGRLIGTPPFMSPEQFATPRDVTAASDVFSLGSLLVYAATGTRPFNADSPYMTGYQVMHEAPVLDGVGEPLLSIVERCLDKDPAARPGTAELHRMLRTLPDSLEAAAVPEPRPQDPRPRPGRPGAVAPTQVMGESGGTAATGAGTGTGTGTGTGRVRRGRRVLVSLAAALAVTGLSLATMRLVSDSDTTPQRHKDSGSPTARGPRAAALPAGWEPWRTDLTRDSGGIDPISYAESGCLRGRDAVYCAGSGFTVTKVDAASGRTLWRSGTNPQEVRPVGARGGLVYAYSLPDDAAAGNRIRKLVALDAGTGKQRWARRIGDVDAEAHLFSRGVLTISASTTEFVAYASSGAELWRSSASAPGGKSCVPLVLGGAPYGLCSSDDDPYGAPMSLVRFDASDGTRSDVATLPPTAEALGVVGGQFLFSVLEDPNKVAQSVGDWSYAGLVRVNPDSGAVKEVPLAEPPRGSATLADGAVYVVRQDGVVTAVSATTGKQLWRRATEVEGLSVPVFSATYGDLYFANRYGRLLALDRDTGAERWRTSSMDDLGDSSGDNTPSLLLVEDAIVAVAGDTVFSVRPDRPATPSATGG
ncbi:serine/threonine-protein kinase [Streptomyces bluensis]|uniref:PQQ-binding-like beta-propeller repeat protein n=1 Tax=Streptomyces bluensis TaxID=33897 RepID=A0ABW6U9S6_9ACTN